MISTWTSDRLHDLIKSRLAGWNFIVVSNREPFMHKHGKEGIECLPTTGGLTTALRPIMAASGGTWIAHGSGEADREVVDEQDSIMVPPNDPSYKLRRVWLTDEQEKGYYMGLANEGLWPLCHVTFTRPVFRENDWQTYKEVNQIFAQAVLDEAGDAPTFVFIQDYHFCLLPRMIKDSGKTNIIVAQFWHIPWPNRETFRIFPWSEELLHGLTGNDLLGFHIRYHCQNFLDTADRHIEARVDREHWTILRGGHETMVRPFPISIDFEGHRRRARLPSTEAAMNLWREKLGLHDKNVRIGVGIERLDYTKGIPDRLAALDLFFETHPEWLGRLSFIQSATSSRSGLAAYDKVESEVLQWSTRINERLGTPDWKPIILIRQRMNEMEMTALHRLSDFIIVNSLHDGMNLVAKEYCASRFDNDGVLILSKFTGAYRELRDALEVNPYAIHEIAAAIHQALTMDPAEKAMRMRRMSEAISRRNVFRWAGKILAQLLHFDIQEENPDESDGDVLD